MQQLFMEGIAKHYIHELEIGINLFFFFFYLALTCLDIITLLYKLLYCTHFLICAQLAGVVEYTDCLSAEG